EVLDREKEHQNFKTSPPAHRSSDHLACQSAIFLNSDEATLLSLAGFRRRKTENDHIEISGHRIFTGPSFATPMVPLDSSHHRRHFPTTFGH
ncbi:hypothetical protein TorRG33x02_267480, partial [Trema orientale]